MRATSLSTFAVLLLIACETSPCPPGSRRAGTSCTFPVHSDAGIETDDGGPQCLADDDGDGFGVSGVFGTCADSEVQPGDCDDADPKAFPGAPVDHCDHADNDCDGKDEPPTNEVCNGADDDCKDGIDNGVTNACGQCGELPVDSCNGVDDDCDGVTDPGMLEKLASGGEHVFVQPGLPSVSRVAGQVGLVPRQDGGAWLLYRATDNPRSAGRIQIVQLAANGALSGTLASAKATDGTDAFAVATDSQRQWVAVAERQRRVTDGLAVDDSVWLRIQLFRASDMTLVSEYAMVSKEDDDSTEGDTDDVDDCDDAYPLDVAVQQDAAGDVYVALIYRDIQGTKTEAFCTALDQTYMRVAKLSKAGEWSLPQAPYKLADARLSTYQAHVKAVPCRNDWMLVYGDDDFSPVWHARRSTIDGQVDGKDLDTFEDVLLIPEIAQQEDCGDKAPTTLVFYSKTKDESYSTHVRRWSTDLVTGALSRVGPDVQILQEAAVDATAVEVGGRWFLAGWTLRIGRGPQIGRAILHELSLNDPSEPSRLVQLFLEGGEGGGNGANPGQTSSAVGFLPAQSALIPTSLGVMVAFPTARDAISTLDSYREEGAVDPAVAVTYAIGCE